MSYQYTDPYGNPHVRGWGHDFTEEERRDRQIGEFNWKTNPGIQHPIPNDNAKGWLQDLLFSSTGNAGGNTLAQDLVGGNIGAGSSPTALKFLKGVGDKLKELWNRPIISPTITKPEHDLLIRGEGGGEKNWQNTP